MSTFKLAIDSCFSLNFFLMPVVYTLTMSVINDGFVKTIRINSEERTNPTVTSSNDFSVSLGSSTQLADINRIAIKQISIPNTQYNIKSSGAHTNNVFTFNDGAVKTITLPAGFYDIASITAALMADPVAIADGLNIVFNTVTKHFDFSSAVPITYLSEASGNIMANVLGITADSAPLVLAFSAGGLPNLAVHPNIYVTSRALSDGSAMISPTLGSIPVCAVVPIDQPFGGIINYIVRQEHLDDIHYLSYSHGKVLQSIDLQLYDGDAQLIDMQGLDWTFVFRAYQVPP